MTSSAPIPTERSSSWKWVICTLLLLASAVNYMDRQTLANASVRITKEFQLTQTQYGVIESVFGYGFAAGSLMFGWLADRSSLRPLYAVVLGLWSATGFATGFARNYDDLLICRTLLGFFEAGHWPCSICAVRILLDARDRSLGNSVLQSGTSIGAIVTPLAMTVLMTNELGSWRIPFQVGGVVGFGWIFLWLGLVRHTDLQRRTAGADEARVQTSGFSSILFSRRLLIVLATLSAINITWQILRAWLPKFLQEGRGYSEHEALVFNAVWFLTTDVGCLGAGVAAVWLGRTTASIHGARLLVFAGCGALCATLLFAPSLEKGWPLLAVLLVAGAGSLGGFPIYHAFTQDLSADHQGKVTGVAGVVGWIATSVAQERFGRLADYTGSLDAGLRAAALLPLLAVLPIWAFWGKDEKDPP